MLKMERDGMIERIISAVSAAPIVVVGKKDSDEVRVRGDTMHLLMMRPTLCPRLRTCTPP